MATKFNTVVTSTATNAQITSAGDDALITKDYADTNYSGGASGSSYYLQAIGSGTQTVGQGSANATTIDLDTSQVSSGASDFTVGSTGEITVTNAGTYFIAYSIDSDQTSGSNRVVVAGFLEVDTSGSFVEVAGSRGHDYSRNSSTEEATVVGSSIVTLSAGDKVRVRSFRDTSIVVTVQLATSHISIHSLAASVGATGVSSATDTSSTGNLAIDLTNVAGTYYTNARSSGTLSIATGAVAGGFAHLRVTYSSEPSVTGATKMAGATYDVSGTPAEMKMVVYNDGSASYYYFLEI
mgnify:CR=1 FL=1